MSTGYGYRPPPLSIVYVLDKTTNLLLITCPPDMELGWKYTSAHTSTKAKGYIILHDCITSHPPLYTVNSHGETPYPIEVELDLQYVPSIGTHFNIIPEKILPRKIHHCPDSSWNETPSCGPTPGYWTIPSHNTTHYCGTTPGFCISSSMPIIYQYVQKNCLSISVNILHWCIPNCDS